MVNCCFIVHLLSAEALALSIARLPSGLKPAVLIFELAYWTERFDPK